MAGSPEKIETEQKKPEQHIPDCSKCGHIQKWRKNQTRIMKDGLDKVYKLIKEGKNGKPELLDQAEKEILALYTSPTWEQSVETA